MEWNNMIFAVLCGAVMLVGGIGAMYQIYKMTIVDAEARGLKHPKFWGFVAMNGNNSSGLLLYLIGRRKYPLVNLTEAGRKEIQSRKAKIGAGLVFLVAGAIGLVFFLTILQ